MRGAPPRRPRGWERLAAVPSEATFSRAFAEFAGSALPSRLHEALIERTHEDRLVGHISRDATAIKAREKPKRKTRPPREAEAPARPSPQGRGTAQGDPPPGAPAGHELARDAGRPAPALRRRHEAQRQGP
ncbi:MAG: hypothetical protein V3V55_01535 [Rhodospirillales bacterium]